MPADPKSSDPRAPSAPPAARDLASVAGRSRLPLELREASGMKKLDWILAQPDPGGFVAELAPQELFYWMLDIGKGDAYALLAYADEDQVRALVDLDAWSKHELVVPRWLEWLDLALAVDIDTGLKFVRAQDDSTYEWLFTGDVVVHPSDADLDFVPDDLAAFHSPDGMYLVTVPREHPLEERLPQLLKLLWASDADRARSLLQQAQFELHANAGEDLERFRAGRLQDLGFEPPTEALAVFATTPVHALRDAVRAGRPPEASPPVSFGDRASGLVMDLVLRNVPAPDLLARALDALAPDLRTRAGEGLAYLVNKVFMAETGDLSRAEDIPLTARYAASVANLGLDYLADSDLEQAVRVLTDLTPELVFRAGHTLTIELGRTARALGRRAGARDGLSLFGTPTDELLHGASLLRPLFFEGLDDARRASYRAFATLDDLAAVESRIAEATELVGFFEERFGFTPAAVVGLPIPTDARARLRFATLLRTALVWALLKDELSFEPIGESELVAFARAAFTGRGEATRWSPAMVRALQSLQGEDVAPSLRRFVERAFDELLDALGRVEAGDLEGRFAADLFILRPTEAPTVH